MCFCIFDFVFTRTEVPFTPRSDDCELRSQSFAGKFETNLVVAFTGSTVSNSVSAFSDSDFYQFFSNQRTSEGSAEQIFLFINSASFNSGPYIVSDEFFFEVEDEAFACTGVQSFVINRVKFVALAKVSTNSNNFAVVVVVFQPRNNYGSVKATGVSQYNFFNIFFFHYKSLL